MIARIGSGIDRIRNALADARQENRSIGFVPTMGFLHEGHQSLIRASASQGLFTVVSIFVNPAQFGPNEDLDTYPRDLEGDFNKCRQSGADLVWYPAVTDLYPAGADMRVDPGDLQKRLCGLSRPRFFGGIATVVLKFFQIIRPHKAFFGKKDFQQLTIIQQMVDQFHLDVEIVGCETIREPDGLAMSSRNARLKTHQRDQALALYRTICAARNAFLVGERDARLLAEKLKSNWPEGVTLDYLEFREPRQLTQVDTLSPCTRLFLGAWLDGVRLIDNAAVGDGH